MTTNGPGKYNDECDYVLDKTEAAAVLLMVFGGNKGNGFELHGLEAVLRDTPKILRRIADEIERESHQEN